MVCVLFLSFLLGGELKLDLCSNNLELLCVLLLDCSCCLLSNVLFGKYSLASDSCEHECYTTSVILYLLFNFMLHTSSSSFFLHKVMNRKKRHKMRTTNPSRIPATAVTTTSLVPEAGDTAPGFVPATACASFQLQPLTEQH